jgi:hypothetical protein
LSKKFNEYKKRAVKKVKFNDGGILTQEVNGHRLGPRGLLGRDSRILGLGNKKLELGNKKLVIDSRKLVIGSKKLVHDKPKRQLGHVVQHRMIDMLGSCN